MCLSARPPALVVGGGGTRRTARLAAPSALVVGGGGARQTTRLAAAVVATESTSEEGNNTATNDVASCREEENNRFDVASSLATTERGRDNNDLNVSRRLNPSAPVFVPSVKLKLQDTSLDQNSSQVLDRGKKSKLMVRSIFFMCFFIMYYTLSKSIYNNNDPCHQDSNDKELNPSASPVIPNSMLPSSVGEDVNDTYCETCFLFNDEVNNAGMSTAVASSTITMARAPNEGDNDAFNDEVNNADMMSDVTPSNILPHLLPCGVGK